jgi:hypothetical protein
MAMQRTSLVLALLLALLVAIIAAPSAPVVSVTSTSTSSVSLQWTTSSGTVFPTILISTHSPTPFLHLRSSHTLFPLTITADPGSTSPPQATTSVTDGSGVVWTVVNGQVF